MDGVTHAMQVHAMMLTRVSRLGSGPQDHEEGCVIHPVTHASSLTRFWHNMLPPTFLKCSHCI